MMPRPHWPREPYLIRSSRSHGTVKAINNYINSIFVKEIMKVVVNRSIFICWGVCPRVYPTPAVFHKYCLTEKLMANSRRNSRRLK